MKIVSRHIERDGSGRVTLSAEEDEDMYHIYNLIQPGDHLRAPAVRRVQNESSTGSIESHRVRLNLTIEVTKTSFDATGSSAPADPSTSAAAIASGAGAMGGSSGTGTSANGGGGGSGGGGGGAGQGATLQVSGRVVEENQHVKMGAFHTLDLERNRNFTIYKDEWDSVHLERLQDASDVGTRAEIAAIVLGDGTAAVCLLTEHMTVIRQRIDVPIPRKRKGSASLTEKAVARFHAQIYNAVLKLLALPALRLVLLASPGFTKDAVYDFLFAEATRRGDKALMGAETKRKFLRIHCNSPHVHSLVEVLRSPEVATLLKDTKFAREGMLLERFLRQLATDELRAWYGESHVFAAAARGAIGVLLISDGLFRAADPARRKQFVALVDEARKQGAEVAIFSSMHESGVQLNNLTGIAAILTYPLDLEVVEEEDRQEREKEAKKLEGQEPELQPNPNAAPAPE